MDIAGVGAVCPQVSAASTDEAAAKPHEKVKWMKPFIVSAHLVKALRIGPS
jgi:hypothetical protein